MPDGSTTVLDFYEQTYRPVKHVGDDHRATVSTYRLELSKLGTYFRETQQRDPTLADLSNELIEGAMAWMVARGRERSTGNKLRRHANSIWEFAFDRGLVPTKPGNKKFREDRAAPVALMPDELEALFSLCERLPGHVGKVRANVWWPACVGLLFSTGLRRCAAFQVRTCHLELSPTVARLKALASTQKQRNDQWLDLHPSAANSLRELRLTERQMGRVLGDWAWRSETFGRKFKELVAGALGRQLNDVGKEYGPHVLRRTLASQIYAASDIFTACHRMGHSNVSVTWRYIDPRYGSKHNITQLIPDPRGPRPPVGDFRLRIADCG